MLSLSNDAKNLIKQGVGYFVQDIICTLSNDVVLRLGNEDILGDTGIEIEDATSTQGELLIGSTIVNSLHFNLVNFDDQFSEYDFYHAYLRVRVGIQIDDETIEYLEKGYFLVTEVTYSESSISITAYDKMCYFDMMEFHPIIQYPAMLSSIVASACTMCYVPNGVGNSFPNASLVVNEAPTATTYREVIGWCAQIAGCFARIDNTGTLRFEWYDLDHMGHNDATDYYHDIESVFSQTIGADDTVITGIKAVVKSETNGDPDETYMYGHEGYVIELTGNQFITPSNAQEIVDSVGRRIVGMIYRRMEITHLPDPSFEAGDIMRLAAVTAYDALMVNGSGLQVNDEQLLISRKPSHFWGIVSYTKFTAGSNQNSRSDSQEVRANTAARYSQLTKAEIAAQESVKKEKTAREEAISTLQQELDDSSGMYFHSETAAGGGTIYYMHNKPNFEDSDVIWKYTADAIAVSTDGGENYNIGVTASGDAVLNRIYAIGIDAGYINTGTLSADRIAANSIAVSKLTGNVTNSAGWSLDFDNGTFSIGEISANKITSGFINADLIDSHTIEVSKLRGRINDDDWSIDLEQGTITVGSVSANNITAGTITGAVVANNFTMNGGTIQVETDDTSTSFLKVGDENDLNFINIFPSEVILGRTLQGYVSGTIDIDPMGGYYQKGTAGQYYGEVRLDNSYGSGALTVIFGNSEATATQTAKIEMDGSAEFTSLEVDGKEVRGLSDVLYYADINHLFGDTNATANNDVILPNSTDVKTYIEGETSDLKTYIDNAVATALQTAKDYADSLHA